MVKQVRKIVALWICALAISACGALEIGIEQAGNAANAQQINWQATAESLQAEATRLNSNGALAEVNATATPTLVPSEIPTIVPPASTPARVAYVSGGDIWIKLLPDGDAQRLTKDGLNNTPSWSGSGE